METSESSLIDGLPMADESEAENGPVANGSSANGTGVDKATLNRLGKGDVTDVGDAGTGDVAADDAGSGDVVADGVATTDEQLLALYASALADGVEQALPGWVAASVVRRLGTDLPDGLPEDFEDRVVAAGRSAADEVGGRVRELLTLDIDEQWTNPLTLIRTAIRYPTEILRSIGVEPVNRDEQAKRFHPDDVYDLTPASFSELGEAVHDLGLSWGAAKAHVHLRRRRDEEVT